MNKTYEAPAITSCGDAVRSTKGPTGLPESAGHTGPGQAIGSVGFHV